MANKAVTRKRASIAETAARVERIIGMMQRGEWRRGDSAPLLAREWGLATATVETMSAEASRTVMREIKDPERLQVDVASVLMTDLRRASQACEFNAVAKLADVVTRVMGARAPERTQEVPMTEEQARARYREITGKEWAA